jgi:glycosyltransferase involved in cell wall biosynthesis
VAATHSQESCVERDAGSPRVVIVHDFMETYGGAERVTAEMAKAFPDAPVYAILGHEDVAKRMGVSERFHSMLPPSRALLRRYRLLTPVLGALTDRLRVPETDVVLSSSYAFAHRVRSRGGAPRVCYCHSPLRFAWSMTESYRGQRAHNRLSATAFDLLARAMRASDRHSAQPIREYLTQSPFTAEQIERFYGREAKVIGAPVDCDLFRPGSRPPGDFYLFCGRLIEPYKQVGIVLEAFRRLDANLVVAGSGPDADRLADLAPPNVRFVGHLDDDQLVPLMQECRALIFPSRDDFGLIPVEAMACGRPVIAYAGGGSLYTSAPGVTGELFDEQTVDAVGAAVRGFRPEAYDPARIRAHAVQWDSAEFRARLVSAVEAADGRTDPCAP